jgi:predicted transglutaminase-like cysteine proteinase
VFSEVVRSVFAAAATLVGLLSGQAHAWAGAPGATFAIVGEQTSVPYGWIDFCGRQPQECNQPVLAPEDLRLTLGTWNVLNQINKEVNSSIEPLSNLEHWGTIADHWDYPIDGKGDCKIYALQKRKALIEKGVPRQALLMTIVRDHNDQGHAILTVKTNKGDFILDNLTDDIRPWEMTGYRFIKRQSQEDPNVWVALEPPAASRKLSAR